MIRRGGSGDHTGLDYWHGMLPNEDTANLLKVFTECVCFVLLF